MMKAKERPKMPRDLALARKAENARRTWIKKNSKPQLALSIKLYEQASAQAKLMGEIEAATILANKALRLKEIQKLLEMKK